MIARRPIPVVVISILLIATGAIGLIVHIREQMAAQFNYDIVGIVLVEIAAIVVGVYMLYRQNWARWLAIAWMAFHVAISFFDWSKVAIHAVFLAAFVYFLFRPEATRYFKSAEIRT
jgi:hypothetical protein